MLTALLLLQEPMALERTLGFVGAVMTLEMLFMADERIEKALPPPEERIALA